MRIIALATSKDICESLKEIANKNKMIQYDCMENNKNLKYYLNIRNYNFILLNSKEIIVDDELLDYLVESIDHSKNIQILYVNPKSERKLTNLEKAELLNKGIIFSIDEDNYLDEYMETLFNSSFSISKNPNIIREGKLLVNLKEESISYDGKKISLVGKPFDVFTFLLKRKNEIITKEELLNSIWVEPELVTPTIIDVCIHQIKQNIDKKLHISTIETIRRRGYRFNLKE